MTKRSRQKTKYIENEKSFWGEKSIFHHFWRVFTCQKLSQTWECGFKIFANFTTKVFFQQEFLFNEVADWKAWEFIKKILKNRCFPVKFAKFLRIPFFPVHLRWLFLVHIMQRNILKDQQIKCKNKKWTAKILRLSESYTKSLVFINISHDVVQLGQSSRILICMLLLVSCVKIIQLRAIRNLSLKKLFHT